MKAFMDLIFTTDFFYSIFRVTTPLLFASMGAVISDVAGVPNIALEGMMLIAAFAGMFFSYFFESALMGLLFALLFAVLCAGVLAFFTLYYKTNIILGGIAINSLASGGTIFFLYLAAHDKGTSVSLPSKVLPNVNIPLIQDIPVIGPAISGHNVLTYLAVAAVIFTFFLLKRTSLGWHIRAVGEKREAADSVGISVEKTQAIALILSGLMCGFGGAFMSMGYVSWFSRDMVSGRGWIALAAEAMGLQHPLGTAATSLLFGVADALSNAVATLGWPSDLVKTIPYCATLAGLAVFSIRTYRRMKNS
ncbi:MAG TPA: ABC transporter permease [Candidatus Lachnoclostridium stercoripullorum]|mgnify:FL=1|uniref:ABC transporter permease n=1 Tax=Candidatus Lachnoclostridium stercoripullorum TaxID=2838635 RepID=A0A9D1W4R7_9FIRM|nr:ABC transporter permease [Candidatus Lachnoclostridium stercoripullorum]